MVYAFFGNNSFAIKRDIGKLRAENQKAEYDVIDVSELEDVDELIQRLSGQSLFSEDKFVVLKDVSKNSAARDAIDKILEQESPNTKIVIQESTLDKRTSYYKSLKKNTQLTEHGHLTEEGAVSFVADYAGKHGAIDHKTATMLVARVGADQQLLMNEIDKLLLFSKNITEQSVLQLTEATPNENAFALTDALTAGKTDQAIHIYRTLRQANEEAFKILGALNWQFFTLLKIQASSNQGSPQAIAKSAGLHPYVVQKNITLVRNITKQHLKKCIQALVDAERRLKTQTSNVDDVMESLLVQLSMSLRS